MSTPLALPPLVAAYLEQAKTHDPTIQLLPKEDSKLMKVIGFIVKPFNPAFNTRYTTTIGSTIWMPSKLVSSLPEDYLLEVIAHEVQHILDHKSQELWFKVSYLFPQVLALLSFLALGAIWSTPWLLWLLCLLFLAPIPAYWRYKAELNGYRVSLVLNKYYGRPSDNTRAWITEQITGPSYYFCWPFKSAVLKELQDESFLTEPRYKEITDFLHKWYGK